MKSVIILGLVLIVFTANVSCTKIDDFTDEVNDFRVRFQDFHMEMDNFIRDSRWNVSDILNAWNIEVIQGTAASVTSVYETNNEIYALILEQALIIGSHKQCVIDMNSERERAAKEAGDRLSGCSQLSDYDSTNAVGKYFFHVVNQVQKYSTQMQQYTLEALARYNTLTERQNILDSLEDDMDRWMINWPLEWVPEIERNIVLVEETRDAAVFEALSCQSNTVTYYNYEADDIRSRIPLC